MINEKIKYMENKTSILKEYCWALGIILLKIMKSIITNKSIHKECIEPIFLPNKYMDTKGKKPSQIKFIYVGPTNTEKKINVITIK
mgnify:CR=1 FL=1